MNTKYCVSLIALWFALIASPVTAVIEQVEFEQVSQEQRYRGLIEELRCVVCQNQNLADSDAPLAKDLREIAADMIRSGASDEEVKSFMRERYGDFVLYRTPFNASTAFLWLGPIVILLLVLFGLLRHLRRRQDQDLITTSHAENDTNRVKVRNLLRDTPDLNDPSSKN